MQINVFLNVHQWRNGWRNTSLMAPQTSGKLSEVIIEAYIVLTVCHIFYKNLLIPTSWQPSATDNSTIIIFATRKWRHEKHSFFYRHKVNTSHKQSGREICITDFM
jgi:hypothetical protein